jgi:hypothetical protein
MLKIAAKMRVGNVYQDLDVPEALTARVAFLLTLVGTDSVVDIQTTAGRTFLCGSEEMMTVMTKAHPTGKIIMSCEDAHKMIEYCPETFCTTIQLFSSPELAKLVFPDKPADKGWEHLKNN